MHTKNLSGQTFGRWTVIKRADNIGRHVSWLCRCECGIERAVSSTNLSSGKSVSCGCYHIAVVSSHGQCKTPEYAAYQAMKQRCYNPRNAGYSIYGGRGITVCERWLHSFENFLADMGRKPSPDHSVDRIDPDKNYAPENCQWATSEAQANNRRNNLLLTFNNKTQTAALWAKEVGLNKSCLLYRLEMGWSIEKALTTPSERSVT